MSWNKEKWISNQRKSSAACDWLYLNKFVIILFFFLVQQEDADDEVMWYPTCLLIGQRNIPHPNCPQGNATPAKLETVSSHSKQRVCIGLIASLPLPIFNHFPHFWWTVHFQCHPCPSFRPRFLHYSRFYLGLDDHEVSMVTQNFYKYSIFIYSFITTVEPRYKEVGYNKTLL